MKKTVDRTLEKYKNELFNKFLSNADAIELLDAIDNFTILVVEESFFFAQVEFEGDDFIAKEFPPLINRYLKDRKKEMVKLLKNQ